MARSGNPSRTVQELLEHPYVKRALEDPEVRDNAKAAYQSAQAAYERIKKQGNPASAVFDDKKLQRELRTTGKSIATAREHLIQRRKRRRGRFVLLTLVGAGLALALSEGLRNKVLDALFGAEEEFDYVSTTAPPAAAAPAAAATPAPEAETPKPAASSAKKAAANSKSAAESADAPAASGD